MTKTKEEIIKEAVLSAETAMVESMVANLQFDLELLPSALSKDQRYLKRLEVMANTLYGNFILAIEAYKKKNEKKRHVVEVRLANGQVYNVKTDEFDGKDAYLHVVYPDGTPMVLIRGNGSVIETKIAREEIVHCDRNDKFF